MNIRTLFFALFLTSISHAKKNFNYLLKHLPPKTRPASIGGRIVNGTEAVPHEFPWLVELRIEGKHVCAGAIINKDFVVTAAHCVVENPMEHFHFVAGDHNMRCIEGTEQLVKVVRVAVHPDFNNVRYPNDIAVLQVQPSFKFNEFVKQGNLAEARDRFFGGATALGWGFMHRKDITSQPARLRKTTIDKKRGKVCEEKYPMFFNSSWNICYGRAGTGPCSTDSGGPLMCKDKICGINSYTGTYCSAGEVGTEYPASFTDLTKFVTFITKNSKFPLPDRKRQNITNCTGNDLINRWATVNLTSLKTGDICHFVFNSREVTKIFTIVESALSSDDELYFSNISHIYHRGRAMKLDPHKNALKYSFGGHPIVIITLRISRTKTEIQRKFVMSFSTSGERSEISPITNFTLHNKDGDDLFFPAPFRENLYYYNDQNVLKIINIPFKRGANAKNMTRVFFDKIDIADADNGATGCKGDHLSILLFTRSGTYRRAGRYCGQKPQSNLEFKQQFFIARFISTTDSEFGKGFGFSWRRFRLSSMINSN